jgi:hypothetical protein
MVKNHLNPKMIDIRTKKIEILESEMNSDPLIRIQYSSKKAGVANSWKRWIGENQGLEKMGTIEKKREFEKRITAWINPDQFNFMRFGEILPRYKELYEELNIYNLVNNYTNEVFFSNGIEAVSLARNIISLVEMIQNVEDEKQIQAAKINLIQYAKNFFQNYNTETDRKLFVAMMTMYGENLESKWLSPYYVKLMNSCKGNFASVVDKYYDKTVFSDEARFRKYITTLNKPGLSKLTKDPFYMLATDVTEILSSEVRPELNRINLEIQDLNRNYMAAQMEFEKERIFYPDANSSLRVTYGTVKGYVSRDAVIFKYNTTLTGIMEKDNPEIYDYDVPVRLKELYMNKDFGRYTQNGEVPVCFIADNHTTGGNSGSPVINADGHLIGVNFDRAWEGIASDLAFSPEQSRNISLDIRYALFIIDKFAGAGYLLNEMTIIE